MAKETREEKIARLVAEDISIEAYNDVWPSLFRSEKEHLLRCLPRELIRRIEHFGSTAVAGLAAKPIVDMLIEVTDLEATRVRIAPILESQAYEYLWRPSSADDVPPFYAWFIKRDQKTGSRTHHLHMVDASFTEHWDRLYFVRYLVEHPEEARRYETLKRTLAERTPQDRAAYTEAKSDFVRIATTRAKELYRDA